jgi:hypothetical protein
MLLLAGCSRLNILTPDLLNQSENKWISSRPVSYQLTIEMSGDRVEKEEFDVSVRAGQIERLRRNGLDVKPGETQDYSMDGLFRMLHQELDLVQKPAVLGAPEGYSAYPMAKFDDRTGRLIEYQRSVGGTSNAIRIKVLQFAAQPN